MSARKVLCAMAAVGCLAAAATNAQIANGDFETGATAPWNFVETAGAFVAEGVVPDGTLVTGLLDPSQALDGTFSWAQSFDGAAGYESQLFQEVAVPTVTGNDRVPLVTNHRIQYDGTLGAPATMDRVFSVTVRDLNNNIIDTLFTHSVDVSGTPMDLGYQQNFHDLTPYAGQIIRISLDVFVPEGFTGPGMIEFDMISSDAQSCDSVVCPGLTGACCNSDGSCVEATPASCQQSGGAFQGQGTDCVTTVCPDLSGACCQPGGICDFVTPEVCTQLGGGFEGSGIMCDANTCDAPDNDDCVNAALVDSLPALVAGNTILAGDDGAPTCVTSNTVGGVWYRVIGTGNELVATTCEGDTFPGSADYDTKLSVFQDCGQLICITGNDDACVGGVSGLRSTVTFCSAPGAEYLILVHGFFQGRGNFELSVYDNGLTCSFGACCFGDTTCQQLEEGLCLDNNGVFQGASTDCANVVCPDLTGACCFLNGTCDESIDEFQCIDQNGTFQGIGATCAVAMCPDLSAPNDDCVDAIAIASLPAIVSGDTSTAVIVETLGVCGTTDGTGGGLWYSIVGTGNNLIATTCDAAAFPGGASYDTKIRIWTGDCAAPVCVAGNDDSCAGGSSGLLSTVEWTADAGVTYFILVHGFGAAVGSFDLSVFENLPGACCFPDTSCTDLTATDCATAGGVFEGTGTACASTVCPDLRGACCLIDGTCLAQESEADCAAAGGTFQGTGTDCTIGCPDLTPPNDDCANAETVGIPSVTFAESTFATADNAPTCGTDNTGPGMWYRLVGEGEEVVVTTCADDVIQPGSADFDTKISVFQNCGALTCIDGNDDGCTIGFTSTVTFCAEAGQEYFILVHGFLQATGFFDLSVYANGTVCGNDCLCELDGDPAQVNVLDLLAFLDPWFDLDPSTDIDGMAGVNVLDLLFFLQCWFPALQGTCP